MKKQLITKNFLVLFISLQFNNYILYSSATLTSKKSLWTQTQTTKVEVKKPQPSLIKSSPKIVQKK